MQFDRHGEVVRRGEGKASCRRCINVVRSSRLSVHDHEPRRAARRRRRPATAASERSDDSGPGDSVLPAIPPRSSICRGPCGLDRERALDGGQQIATRLVAVPRGLLDDGSRRAASFDAHPPDAVQPRDPEREWRYERVRRPRRGLSTPGRDDVARPLGLRMLDAGASVPRQRESRPASVAARCHARVLVRTSRNTATASRRSSRKNSATSSTLSIRLPAPRSRWRCSELRPRTRIRVRGRTPATAPIPRSSRRRKPWLRRWSSVLRIRTENAIRRRKLSADRRSRAETRSR